MRLHGVVLLGSAALCTTLPGCKTAGSLPTWEADAPSDEAQLAAANVDSEGDLDVAGADEDAAEPADDAVEDPAAATADPDGGVEPESRGQDDTPSGRRQSGKGQSGKGHSGKSRALPKPVYAKVDDSCGNDPGVGQRLKSFKLATPDGKSISNGTYRGRVMLVNFWGTWCKPCLEELPEFDRLYRRYRKHGMTLVAIATDEDAMPVNAFVDKRRLAARVLIGGEAYANQYGSPKFPFTFVVDPKGVIRASYRGYRPECMGKLEADIREQLQKRNG